MLFSSKINGYICDQGDDGALIARVSSLKPPTVIEAFAECADLSQETLKAAIASVRAQKSAAYLRGYFGVSAESRFVRRATLDLKRIKEADYLSEVANGQFRIDPEQYQIAIINAYDGIEFDPVKPTSKEVVFCGMSTKDTKAKQEQLLALGLFPERIELSSMSAIGAVIDYLRFSASNKPTIILEIGAQSTQSHIVTARGLEASRPIAVGLEAMVPVVQKELGLKDEESARKLFFSNTFDFTGMGASLCRRLLKELQSSMGFYEVQTGQSIAQLICVVLPEKLAWLEAVIASQVGVNVLAPDYSKWMLARGITVADDLQSFSMNSRKLGLIGLIIQHSLNFNADAVTA